MQINPERSKGFGSWNPISNFDSNGATWTAPSDGFLIVRFSATATSPYIYVSVGGRVLGTIAMSGASAGYSYTTMVAVTEGETYTMSTNQSSGISPFFKPILG